MNINNMGGFHLDKKILLFSVLTVLIIGSVGVYFIFFNTPKEKDKVIREETKGGKYQARIEISGEWQQSEVGEIIYVKDGETFTGYFDSGFEDALNWIQKTTSEDTIFLNWWDYGHMIIGYAERETVCKGPSEEALESVADQSSIKEFEPHEKIVDVAQAMTTRARLGLPLG
jgi:hypothetical protein